MLQKKLLTVFTLALFLLLWISGTSFACWAYLTPEELFQQSNLVLAGKIVGPANEFKDEGFWMTNWIVEVDYIFQGTAQTSQILVATPGADNKNTATSIDYKLNAWGEHVILFLRNRQDHFEPLSPQGIIPVKSTGTTLHSLETGDEFFQVYQLAENVETDEMQEIVDILKGKELSVPRKTNMKSEQTLSFLHRLAAFIRSLFAEKIGWF